MGFQAAEDGESGFGMQLLVGNRGQQSLIRFGGIGHFPLQRAVGFDEPAEGRVGHGEMLDGGHPGGLPWKRHHGSRRAGLGNQ
jgi:hypothetical protein